MQYSRHRTLMEDIHPPACNVLDCTAQKKHHWSTTFLGAVHISCDPIPRPPPSPSRLSCDKIVDPPYPYYRAIYGQEGITFLMAGMRIQI